MSEWAQDEWAQDEWAQDEWAPDEGMDGEAGAWAGDRAGPRWRLYALRGMPCPLCRRGGRPECVLAWTGVSLACALGHGWSNADALRADLLAELRGPGGE